MRARQVVNDGEMFRDGHGEPDLAVSARFVGTVYVFLGPLPPGAISVQDADAVLTGGDGDFAFGAELVGGVDVDADGVPDLLVAGPSDGNGPYAGAAHLFSGAHLAEAIAAHRAAQP
jgi:hypothetical protein